MGQLGHEPVLVWDVGVTGIGFTWPAPPVSLEFVSLSYCYKPVYLDFYSRFLSPEWRCHYDRTGVIGERTHLMAVWPVC